MPEPDEQLTQSFSVPIFETCALCWDPKHVFLYNVFSLLPRPSTFHGGVDWIVAENRYSAWLAASSRLTTLIYAGAQRHNGATKLFLYIGSPSSGFCRRKSKATGLLPHQFTFLPRTHGMFIFAFCIFALLFLVVCNKYTWWRDMSPVSLDCFMTFNADFRCHADDPHNNNSLI